MAFARTDLAEILGKQLLEASSSRSLAKQIAAYLIEQKRVSELESLMRDIMAYRHENGVIEAEVASAHPLDASMLKQVEELVKDKHPDAKHVFVHEHLDRSLVGGITITMAHEKLDMSVKSKLDTFKRLTTEGITK